MSEELRESSWLSVEDLQTIVKNLDSIGYNQLAQEIRENVPLEDTKTETAYNLSQFKSEYLMNLHINKKELIRISKEYDLLYRF